MRDREMRDVKKTGLLITTILVAAASFGYGLMPSHVVSETPSSSVGELPKIVQTEVAPDVIKNITPPANNDQSEQVTDDAKNSEPVSKTYIGDEGANNKNPDEGLWALYSEGKLAEIRAQMAVAETPPSEGFMSALDGLEVTERVLNAASMKQWKLVMSLLQAHPNIIVCERPDLITVGAQAVYMSGQTTQGLQVVSKNLSGCVTDADARRELAVSVGQFATPTEIDDLSETVNDPSLDDAFEEARNTANVRVVDEWTSKARTPRYVRPGDERPLRMDEDPTPDPSLRPIPDKRVEGTNLSTTVMVDSDIPDAKILAAATELETMVSDLPTDDVMALAWFRYVSGDPISAASVFSVVGDGEEQSLDAIRGQALSYMAYEAYVEAEALLPARQVSDWPVNQTYLLTAAQLVAHADRKEGDPLKRGDLTLNDQQAGRILEAANKSKSWDLAERLGWHAHRVAGCRPAIPWWRVTISHNPEMEAAAFGLALCLPHDTEEAQILRTKWSPRSSRIATLFGDVAYTALAIRPEPRPGNLDTSVQGDQFFVSDVPQVIVAANVTQPEQVMTNDAVSETVTVPDVVVENSAQAPATTPRATSTSRRAVSSSRAVNAGGSRSSQGGRCNPNASPASLSASDALATGWCLMEAGNNKAASAAFDKAMSGNASARKDAAYGKSLIDLREGDYKSADAQIRTEVQSEKRRSEIAASVLAQQALDEFNKGPNRSKTILEALDKRAAMVKESPDLMVVRGWALYRANRVAAARKIWREAAELGSADAEKALRDSLGND